MYTSPASIITDQMDPCINSSLPYNVLVDKHPFCMTHPNPTTKITHHFATCLSNTSASIHQAGGLFTVTSREAPKPRDAGFKMFQSL